MDAALELSLVRAAAGDESAFDEVYRAAAPRLFGLARRVLNDAAVAEEVVQDALLEAWSKAHRFDPARGRAMAWLMQITHARAVDRVRSIRAQRNRDLLDDARRQAEWVASVPEHAEASIEASRVRVALSELSAAQREAIVLAYFGGMTHSEIAAYLDVPLGTAKTRVRDGMRRLRDLLQHAAGSPQAGAEDSRPIAPGAQR